MIKYGIKPGRLDAIFISHMHGDHFLGLPGLLDSMQLSGRENPLSIIGPPILEEYISFHQKLSSGLAYAYPIHYIITENKEPSLVFENSEVAVEAVPLEHLRISCYGFIFREKIQDRKMDKQAIQTYKIPFDKIAGIKKGDDFETESGELIPNEQISHAPPTPRSYAFFTDTIYLPEMAQLIQGVSMLYHEATYLHDLVKQAKERGHATALEAAQLAKKAKAGQLLLGHFSSRYKDLKPMVKEARTVFKNTYLALEGERFSL